MVNTDEIQVGSCSLARQQYFIKFIKRSVWFYNLRQFKQSQRQGGAGRQTGKRTRGTPVGVSRSTGGEQVGPTPAGFPRPVVLDNLGRAVALLQSVFGELSAAHRERSLGGPLLALLDRLAAESQGGAPTGEVMPEPVAPGDLAAILDPDGIFGSEADTSEMGVLADMMEEATAEKENEREGVMAEIKAAPLTPKAPEADSAGKEGLTDVREEAEAVKEKARAEMEEGRAAAAGREAAARAAAKAAGHAAAQRAARAAAASVNRVRNVQLERKANERCRTEAAARLARGAAAAEAAEKEKVMAVEKEIGAAPLTEADTAGQEE